MAKPKTRPKIDWLDAISLGFYRIPQNMVLLETPLDGIEDEIVADRVADRTSLTPEQLAEYGLLRSAIERLPEQECRLLKLHYYDGLSLKQISLGFNRSRTWAMLLRDKAIRHLQIMMLPGCEPAKEIKVTTQTAPKCLACNSKNVRKGKFEHGRQEYVCNQCEVTFIMTEPNDANGQRSAALADPVAQPVGQKATAEQPKQVPVASPPSTPAPAQKDPVIVPAYGSGAAEHRAADEANAKTDAAKAPAKAVNPVPVVTLGLLVGGLCSKCGEPVMKGQDHCDKCGEPAKTIIPRFEDLPAVPPKPTGGGKGSGTINLRISKYYDQHREQIELELKRYGITRVLERWHIGGGTWVGLKRRWTRAQQPKLPLQPAVSKPKSPVLTEATIPEGKPGDEWRETRPLGPFKDSRVRMVETPPQSDGKYPVNLSLKALAMNIDVAVSLFDSDVLKRINQGEHPFDAFSDAFTDWTSDVIPERLATWAAALANPDVSQTLSLIAGFITMLTKRCPTDEPASEPRGKRNESEAPADGMSLVPVTPGDQLPAVPEPVGKAIDEIREELKAINENLYNIYNQGLGVGLTEAHEAEIVWCFITAHTMDVANCTKLVNLIKALEGV